MVLLYMAGTMGSFVGVGRKRPTLSQIAETLAPSVQIVFFRSRGINQISVRI